METKNLPNKIMSLKMHYYHDENKHNVHPFVKHILLVPHGTHSAGIL